LLNFEALCSLIEITLRGRDKPTLHRLAAAAGGIEAGAVEAGEEGASANKVALNLRAQGVGAGEFLFVAETMPETNFEWT